MTSRIRLDDKVIRTVLGDPDTQGLILFTIILQEFGDGVMGDDETGVEPMDPAEMWAGLHARFGTWMTEEGENRVNAIITGLQDGRFWRDLETFMAVSTALFDGDLGDMIDVGFEDLSATEVMWAILEMSLVWNADETPEFSLSIKEYVDQILLHEQEDLTDSVTKVEKAYAFMLDQLIDLGVPHSMLRALDEEYSTVMESMEDGRLD